MESFTIIIEDDRDGPSITIEQSNKHRLGHKQTPARKLFNYVMSGLVELKKHSADLTPKVYGADGEPIEIADLQEKG